MQAKIFSAKHSLRRFPPRSLTHLNIREDPPAVHRRVFSYDSIVLKFSIKRKTAICALSFPQILTNVVFKLSRENLSQVMPITSKKAPKSTKVQDSLTNSAYVEQMQSKVSSKQAQPKCSSLVLIAGHRNVVCHVTHPFHNGSIVIPHLVNKVNSTVAATPNFRPWPCLSAGGMRGSACPHSGSRPHLCNLQIGPPTSFLPLEVSGM